MEEYINELRNRKMLRYKEDYSEMLAEYNRELETVKGYNGRQILELLQNCDDEGSKEVLFELNKEKNTISISNNGSPFSKKGYRSLFIANLSSKTSKRKYIGNKGLGFRSVINWCSSIIIQSNNVTLKYSEENTLNLFNSLFSITEQDEIRNEENFGETHIPLPFLCIPEIIKEDGNGYITTIILTYKPDYYESIIEQINKISQETILFLKNICEINFIGFDDIDNIKCIKESLDNDNSTISPNQKISFEDAVWYVFEEECDFPSEFRESENPDNEFYQIKIAVEENFKKTSPYLYSFFPTKILLNQPYILHATFDLDSTRNQINDSLKNKYILKKIVEFTVNVAKFYAKESLSYRPLQILFHSHIADSLANLGYYGLIDDAIKSEEIFPCIDNRYKKLEDVIYVSNAFAKMLTDVKAEDIIDCHILPINDATINTFVRESKIDKQISVLKDYIGLINKIAALNLSIKLRALFIYHIVQECTFIKNEYENKINFLINEKFENIPGEEFIYTPITQNLQLRIPTYTKIQFINKELFDELLGYFNYNTKDNSGKSRYLYDQLKGFCNIHSYEPATLALKIISETNNQIQLLPNKSILFVKEMNQCLFFNYKLLDEETKKSKLKSKVNTITIDDAVKLTEDVVLSDYYETGKKTTQIFKGIYGQSNYVGSPEQLGLDSTEDIYEIESYLQWINVNKFAKYITKIDNGLLDYFNHIRGIRNFNSKGHEITYKTINNLVDILKIIDLNNLIIWINFDEELSLQLNDKKHTDKILNSWYGSSNIRDFHSYIKYKLLTQYRYNFNNILLDEKLFWFNEFTIDYRAKEFVNNNISKTRVNDILISLGAKDDFNDLSIEKVTNVIRQIPRLQPDGKRTQTIYKKALGHYKENHKELVSRVKLFADNGTKLELLDQDKIYFSDKIKLPSKLRSEFPIFNFPARSGSVEAIKFFKINDLKNIKIEIVNHLVIDGISANLKLALTQLKPLILAYRISVIEDSVQQKVQAAICNKIQVILCSEIYYKVNEKNYSVSDYEFLHYDDNLYYLKVRQDDTLDLLRRNLIFIDSFADIICLSFDISSDKNEFKNLIKHSYEDVLMTVKADLGNDVIQESRDLLGLTDYKYAFWCAVFISKGLSFTENIDDSTLEEMIITEFNCHFDVQSIDYEKINNSSELFKIKHLFHDINLELEVFAKVYVYKISFESIHYGELVRQILSKKNLVKSSIWKKLNDKTIEDKATFLREINKYENYDHYVSQVSLENEHNFIIDYIITAIEYIKFIYGEIEIYDSTEFEEIRNNNLRLFDQNEEYEVLQNEELKSLIYFSNTYDEIKSRLNKSNTEKNNDVIDEFDVESIKPKIIDSNRLKRRKFSIKNKSNSVDLFMPNSNNERHKKRKGNRSEQIVFNYLKSNPQYNNVYWVSDDNEGLHYDIRYVNEHGKLKYVEVKTFDYSLFYLSSDEYNFGVDHKDDYEIWLVNNQINIIPIKDFFDNEEYKIEPNQFTVSLELENTN